jgi:hypothetical protein
MTTIARLGGYFHARNRCKRDQKGDLPAVIDAPGKGA